MERVKFLARKSIWKESIADEWNHPFNEISFSVRRFKEEAIKEADLKEILSAGQMASSWKNFQSYSVIVVKSKEKKSSLRLASSRSDCQSDVFLLFIGDLNRAEKSCQTSWAGFPSWRVDNLLITSVDAALAAQNTLLAAESLGYGGVMIGMLRYCSEEVAALFRLPDYTYPVFGIALEYPTSNMQWNHACHWSRLLLKKNTKNKTYQLWLPMTRFRQIMLERV